MSSFNKTNNKTNNSKDGDVPSNQTPPISSPSLPRGSGLNQEGASTEASPQRQRERHHQHLAKKKNHMVLPRKRDVIIGATHHSGTKHCSEIVESIFNDSGGISYNPRIYDAIWYELNNPHHIKILRPVDTNHPGDLKLEARQTSEKERENFIRDCHVKLGQKRASVDPPRVMDVWMSNEDHPGTEACMAIVHQMATKHFERGGEVYFGQTIYEYITRQLEGRRFLDRPLGNNLPWHAATPKERKQFIHEAFLKARQELEDKSMHGASAGAPLG
jgi:hypothetical protein